MVPWSAIVAVTIYIIGSTIGFVWWMATITEQMKTLLENIKTLNEKVSISYSKEDAVKDFAYRDKEIEAIWKKLDVIHINGNGAGH